MCSEECGTWQFQWLWKTIVHTGLGEPGGPSMEMLGGINKCHSNHVREAEATIPRHVI